MTGGGDDCPLSVMSIGEAMDDLAELVAMHLEVLNDSVHVARGFMPAEICAVTASESTNGPHASCSTRRAARRSTRWKRY